MSALAAITRRLRNVLRLGVLLRSDDTGAVRLLQAQIGDETLTDIAHIEPYGFTSRAKTKAALVLAALKGNPAHTVCLNTGGGTYRLTGLAEGEAALYDDLGNVVHLMRDKIRVNAVTALDATAPVFNFVGNVNITGDTSFTGTVKANGFSIDETSRHSGVTPGSGTSGTVV